MSEDFSHVVGKDERGERLDVLLSELPGFASRSAAAKAIEGGNVFVNDSPVSKKYSVREGDLIEYSIPDPVAIDYSTPYDIDLDVRYEDEGMLVISKPAGLVCHPSPGHYGETLVNALIAHCGKDHLANLQGDDRLGIVHRLDMDTSGLMLAAKTDEYGYILQDGIRTRNIDRRYMALVHGYIAKDSGYIDAPIGRHPKIRLKMAISDARSARSAVTTFKVLERFEAGRFDDGFSLIECKLFSGRTHQIRVHMNYIGHCVVGDPMYGSGNDKANLGLERQFLHSYRLNLEHPITGEEMEFTDHLPPDLQEVLDSIADRSMGKTAYGEEIEELLDNTPNLYVQRGHDE
ncbi:MAG: RluA family pseudouridine synthase [Coriobacteriales bacterium]|jgi:23S rRNA pseudouridine1911/1915/1917 synthase